MTTQARTAVETFARCFASQRQGLAPRGPTGAARRRARVSDLAMQGWIIRVRGERVEIRPPPVRSPDRAAEKARIRRQELVKRDAQLRQPSVQRFMDSMERQRVHNGHSCRSSR